MDRETLKRWLLDHGYAEPKPGYGHVSADDLADALLDDFDIYEKFSGGTTRGTEKY